MKQIKRCKWAESDKDMMDYHDHVWGRPVHDDNLLFACLTLDGAQAGLSWSTILKKKQGYYQAFDNFDFNKIALYDENKIAELLENPAIVRNRLKILSVINNAKCVQNIIKDHGSFNDFIWHYTNYQVIINDKEVQSRSELSDIISADLKKYGFKFVGTTIIHAFLQAVGVILDHERECHVYQELVKGEVK